MNLKKLQSRREIVLVRLKAKVEKSDREKKEIGILTDRLAGKRKIKRMKVNAEGQLVAEKDKYYLDIMTVSFSKVKHSDRRKNKGKSRKKMRNKKTVTLLKSVILQPGMLQSYREGRMGLSPKTHSFRIRKHEEFTI